MRRSRSVATLAPGEWARWGWWVVPVLLVLGWLGIKLDP